MAKGKSCPSLQIKNLFKNRTLRSSRTDQRPHHRSARSRHRVNYDLDSVQNVQQHNFTETDDSLSSLSSSTSSIILSPLQSSKIKAKVIKPIIPSPSQLPLQLPLPSFPFLAPVIPARLEFVTASLFPKNEVEESHCVTTQRGPRRLTYKPKRKKVIGTSNSLRLVKKNHFPVRKIKDQFDAPRVIKEYLPARKVKNHMTDGAAEVIQKIQGELGSPLTSARQKDVDDELQPSMANVPDFPLTLFPTIPWTPTGVHKGFRKLTTLPGFHTFGRPNFERIRIGGYKIPKPKSLEPEPAEYTYVPNLPSFEHKEATPPAAVVASTLAAAPPSLEAIKNSGLFSPFEIKCFDECPDLTKMDSSSTSFQILFTNVMEKYGISSTGFFDGSTEPLEVTRDSAPDTMMSIQLSNTPAFLSRLRRLARDKLVTVDEELRRRMTLQEPGPMPFETIHINNDKLSDMFQVPKGIYVLKKEESPPMTSFKIDIDALGPRPFGYQPRNPFDSQRYIPKILSAIRDDGRSHGCGQMETETQKKIAKVEIPNVDILTNTVYIKREKVSESECNAPDCCADLGPDTISENKCLPTTTLHYDPMDTDSDPSAFLDMNCDDLFRNFGADIEMLNQNVYLEDPRFDFNLVDFINSSDLI